MAPVAIVLSDSEDELSPQRARKAALQQWRPRKERPDRGRDTPLAGPDGGAIKANGRHDDSHLYSARPSPQRSLNSFFSAGTSSTTKDQIDSATTYVQDQDGVKVGHVERIRRLEGFRESRGNITATTQSHVYLSASDGSANIRSTELETQSPSRKRRRTQETTQPMDHRRNGSLTKNNGLASHAIPNSRDATRTPSTKVVDSASLMRTVQSSRPLNPPALSFRTQQVPILRASWNPYTADEDALLIKLKRDDGLRWSEIAPHFPSRSQAALQTRYSAQLKPATTTTTDTAASARPATPPKIRKHIAEGVGIDGLAITSNNPSNARALANPPSQKRGGGPSVTDGLIRWDMVGKAMVNNSTRTPSVVEDTVELIQDCTRMLSRVLRARELGDSRGRSGRGLSASEELHDIVFSEYHLRRYFTSTCGDVTCLAWSPNGANFAAGSIALTDDRSMQYNSNLNLLVGDCNDGAVYELPEHHIQRPLVGGTGNVNASQSMQESQDSRLFMTVASVCFSPDGEVLYSAGSDKSIRAYGLHKGLERRTCTREIACDSSVDILSISNTGLLAAACHSSQDGSILVYKVPQRRLTLSPTRLNSALPLFPSALSFGLARQHSNLLLAGYSTDGSRDARNEAGETCLWDVNTGQRISMGAQVCGVFAVGWNPSPSPASIAFAVASTPGPERNGRLTNSVVNCFAPSQSGARQVLIWDCPARDINELVLCPFDGNLVAAGATDGKVYVWDKRFAKRDQSPLHSLAHGSSLNVLDHEREVESIDTGIRFLSWGTTSSRLTSASSDGVVKVWNPYRSTINAHVRDLATFESAIMSGAFSPDHRELLIGEERGRINLLSIQELEGVRQAVPRFKLHPAPQPSREDTSVYESARELLRSGQIELRPMGDLPIRQAVQGPSYNGPYLKPSKHEWIRSKTDYENAAEHQNEQRLLAERQASQASESGAAICEADKWMANASMALADLQRRRDASAKLELGAQATQKAFRKADKARLCRPPGDCEFDCNYLPRDVFSEGLVPDSRYSEQRIPDAYRSAPRGDTDLTTLDCKQLYNAGLAGQCPHCSAAGPSALMKLHLSHPERITNPCLQRLASVKADFFDKETGSPSKCLKCFAPVRWSDTLGGSTKLCARCQFACIRCAGPAVVSSDGASVACDRCEKTWDIGVLGYDLSDADVIDEQAIALSERRCHQTFDCCMHHYHKFWGTDGTE